MKYYYNKLVASLLITTLLTTSSLVIAQSCDENTLNHWKNNRYTHNDNGTITDIKTGLIWKKCSEGLSGTDCKVGADLTYNWKEALQAASDSTFATHSDWRLPNIKELGSLISYSCFTPSINETAFPATSDLFWTSTPRHSYIGEDEFYTWVVNFGNGGNHEDGDRRDLNKVRLVR